MIHTLDRLEAAAHNAPLIAALKSLRAASRLVDSAIPQAIDLSAVWFPSVVSTPETVSALFRFGADSANYAAAVTQLRDLDVKNVVANFARLAADPVVHRRV